MSRLLYIESSPRKNNSSSITIANEFITKFKELMPEIEIDKLDLWQEDLPEFNNNTIEAKYTYLHGKSPVNEQLESWGKIQKIVDRFATADYYLFSIPMWNFSIPYVLKHYIDILIQPELTFKFSPETGYKGLINAKSTSIIYTRGGAYNTPETEGLDLQKKYMDLALGFIGINDINNIIWEPTLGEPQIVNQAKESALEQVREVVQAIKNNAKEEVL